MCFSTLGNVQLVDRQLPEQQQREHGLLQTEQRQQPVEQDTQALAMCAVFKDQNPDIRTWVEYHYRMGFDAFYILDDGSKEPATAELADYIAAGVVHYDLVSRRKLPHPMQKHAYGKCLAEWGSRHTWMAFLDVDEFIVVNDPRNVTLLQLLTTYQQFGGVGLNWIMFGSSGHTERPPDGVSQYTACTPPSFFHNKHIKSVVNIKHTSGRGTSPHHFSYANGYWAVNTDGQKIDGPFNEPPTYGRAHINHYFTKSLAEFQEKIERGAGNGSHKTMQLFHDVNEAATETCPSLQWPPPRSLPAAT
ncbi:hypothetical protein JKP88DRAFT_353045 [Tribonema minus]|uniref:Glycosyltransferase family 92 protein n=1 Tax=Tribonema minus TaxID=303371 RepID=A0A836CKH1_9STRA|nr:hypothetical protein JKP88DRAFT_353045 [Tribonema minus]